MYITYSVGKHLCRKLAKKLKRETTEEHFNRRRGESKYYPFFQSNYKGVYFFQIRSIMLYIMSVLFAILMIILIVILTQDWKSWLVIVITSAEIIILFLIVYWSPIMTYVINQNTLTYQYYKGKTKVKEGPFTDIYIRLQKDESKKENALYYIVLSGTGIDSVRLTKKDNNIPQIREHGQNIAEANNLNYFDKENISPHHKIIHKKEKDNDSVE